MMDTPQHLFALDIGTRSVVGLIGEISEENTIRIVACERQEHHTRAMLDGQIHDVLEVAEVIKDVKERLEKQFGPLKSVSVAAAGRALCTIKSSAEIELVSHGPLTAEDETALELTAIQNAQHQLATSGSVANPADYYCVGYSVISFSLDGMVLKSLIGQRGRVAAIELIATFLPKQVVDSLESSIQAVGLDMATLTLEPIAAIHVLIPPTMRHLNLALVDIGAGTSDVALTKGGTIIGYGMVPCAGDEITEAISQKYLLDFNVAERAKRELHNENHSISFSNVLGFKQEIPAQEIIESITPTVIDLAQSIAKEILSLNSEPPQAVLLVGGGSLTPLLPVELAAALAIDKNRVAIRRPEAIEGIPVIPEELQVPDAVTPLGILKLSSCQNLNFISITLNNDPLRLFNLGHLTIADALLASGVDVRNLTGRPGLGLTLTLNGATKFIPGSPGKSGHITLNGQSATFDDPVADHDSLTITKGEDGLSPAPTLQDLIAIPPEITITVNNKLFTVAPLVTINDKPAKPEDKLVDRDTIVCRSSNNLREVLDIIQIPETRREYHYKINGTSRTYLVEAHYKINSEPAALTSPVPAGAVIEIVWPPEPRLYQVVGMKNDCDEYITVHFNKQPCSVPSRRWQLTVNGNVKPPEATAPDGATIEYRAKDYQPMISDVMLAAKFAPPSFARARKIEILLNGVPAEYTSLVKNQDKVDIIINLADPVEPESSPTQATT